AAAGVQDHGVRAERGGGELGERCVQLGIAHGDQHRRRAGERRRQRANGDALPSLALVPAVEAHHLDAPFAERARQATACPAGAEHEHALAHGRGATTSRLALRAAAAMSRSCSERARLASSSAADTTTSRDIDRRNAASRPMCLAWILAQSASRIAGVTVKSGDVTWCAAFTASAVSVSASRNFCMSAPNCSWNATTELVVSGVTITSGVMPPPPYTKRPASV